MREGHGPMTATHLIVGGGLAGGLAALALAESRRGARVTLLEAGTRLAGNHTWSFHESDLEGEARALVMPLVARRWPRHDVRFPGQMRSLEIGYATVTSHGFDRGVTERLVRAGCRVVLGRRAVSVEAGRVVLDDGSVLTADTVLDARGPEVPPPGARGGAAGYQKFVGLELDLSEEGPWEVPVVMDADVPQLGGLRFVYVLPFSRRHVLVEDTVYADRPDLDAEELELRVVQYARERGARVRTVLRRESGVLPLPLVDDSEVGPRGPGGPHRIGYRGGFFHPVTGYSLPLAARVARALAEAPAANDVAPALAAVRGALAPQRRFGRLLNRLMFRAMDAGQRWTALARFYRLPEATIARFYASRSTGWDRARLLFGRPPAGVSWRRLAGLSEAAA
jgi:lycopene beta-cyclase